jgi:hypothetical protein
MLLGLATNLVDAAVENAPTLDRTESDARLTAFKLAGDI